MTVADCKQAVGLELVKIILLTIPYVIASSSTDLKAQANELLGKTDIIASVPRDAETVVDPFLRVEGLSAPQPYSILAMLQHQLQGEAAQDWPLQLLPRLFKPFKKDEDLIDMGGANSKEHAFPSLSIPQQINSGVDPIFPTVYFSVYSDQDIEVRCPPL